MNRRTEPAPSAAGKAHIVYFDYLRLFAAAGVVYMHTAASGLRAGVVEGGVTGGWHLLDLVTSLAFTAVPLFFMVSGYLLLSDAKTARADILLRRRLPRLVVPLAVWTLVYALWNCVEAKSFSAVYVLEQLAGALRAPIIVPLWFMYTLIPIYVLSPVIYGGIHGLDKTGKRLALALIALVSLRSMVRDFLPAEAAGWLNFDLLNKLQALGGYLLIFVLGYYLGSTKRRFPNWLLGSAAGVCFVVIAVGTWRLTLRDGAYSAAFQDQSAGFEVLLAACLFLLAKQNLHKEPEWLRAVAPLLFPVYLMHGLFLKVMYFTGTDPLRFPAVVGFTALNLAVCLLAAKILSLIKPLCYAFTGQRYGREGKR